MISVSLPFGALTEGTGIGSDEFLETLRMRGAESIELRTVRGNADPDAVLKAAERVWDRGLRISIHASPRSADSAVKDIFGPAGKALEAGRQTGTVLVMHPVKGEDTVSENLRMLEILDREVKSSSYDVMFALENNRLMPDRSVGDSAGLVAELIKDTDPAHFGICFDMGHYAWVTKIWENDPVILPPGDFTGRAVHTHIHALAGAELDYNTHFPLTAGTLPLREYIGSLGERYAGAFNLELEPERFENMMSGEEGILTSLEVLKRYCN